MKLQVVCGRWDSGKGHSSVVGELITEGIKETIKDVDLYNGGNIDAIPHLKEEKIAAVSGVEEEVLDESTTIGGKMLDSAKLDMPIGEVDMVGTAIFKREVLNEVGPHNPYLKGGEDRDLAYRIRSAGYKLLRIDQPSVYHYWAKKSGKLTLRRYLKSAYTWSKGDGQAMRSSIGNESVSIMHLKRYLNTYFIRLYLNLFLFVSFFYLNIVSFIFLRGNVYLYFTIFINTVILILASLYAHIRYKGGKWNEFLFSLHVYPYAFVRHIGFILGFLKKPKDPSTYPTTVKIIKE